MPPPSARREAHEYPDRLAVEEALATQYLYAILPRQSAEHLNSALKLAPWREDLAISLLNAQRMRMDFAESLAAVEHGLTYNPDSRTLRLAYAELLARNGRAAEADAILTAHLRRAPLDVSARESAGRWLIDAGQRERGIEELHHAAQLQPQQKSLQGYLEFLSAALPDLPSRFRVALDLEKEHPDLLADETARGSAILLDSRTIERLPSGGQRTYHQQVIRISGPSGAKSWSRIPLLYAPSRQRLDVLSARLLKPDGRSFPAREFTTGLLSDPAIRTYYDDSYWVADFSAANPAAGDIIELEYVLSDQLRDATALRFLGTVVQPQREIPVARFILRILLPSDSSLTCAAFRTAGLALAEQPARQQLGHQEALIWDARSLPAIPLEPQAPPYASLLPAIVISPFVSWEELGQWYRGFIEEQLQPDDRITDKAAELAPPEMDRRHRIAAIYSWVTTQTRYVGLELGVHGYKPYAASDVFLRRFGDCKDKSALLCALLNSADIAAWPVILRTQNAGDLPADVPALTLFNHMICYLPDDDIWLDPTVMDGTLAEFPISDQNCLCLKLPPAGPYLQPERSPSSPPALNTAHLMIDVRLKKGGAAEAALTLDANGELARALRSGVREATADVMAEEMAAREIREAAISTVFWDPGAVTGSRVKLRADAALHVTTDTAGAVSFPCLGSPLHLLSAYGAFPFRRLPLNAETPRTIKRTVRIRIPRRARVSNLPEGVHLEGSYGSFSAEFKVEKREVTGTATLIWHGGTIRPTDYLGFRAFCSQIDMLFQQSIRLHLPQRFRQPPVNEPAEHAPR